MYNENISKCKTNGRFGFLLCYTKSTFVEELERSIAEQNANNTVESGEAHQQESRVTKQMASGRKNG